MKKVLSFLALVLALNTYAQDYWYYNINFDDPGQLFRVIIDTVNYPNNVWQIGEPQKTHFNAAYSLPNATVTDLNKPYPANDTSVFMIKHISQGGFFYYHTSILSGYYKVDADTLNDYGLIEFSPDNGETWIDLVNDTIYNQYYYWYTPKPVLTGRTYEWTHFYVNIAELGLVFDIDFYDTLLYRFSFISDQQLEHREGLIFDDLHFEDWWEGISENEVQHFKSTAYPVPSSTFLNIEFENQHHQAFDLLIYNAVGQTVFSKFNFSENSCSIDLNDFDNGIYYYKLFNNETGRFSTGKLVVKK
jgi:hypothetical protein